jgi:hypothetical protein
MTTAALAQPTSTSRSRGMPRSLNACHTFRLARRPVPAGVGVFLQLADQASALCFAVDHEPPVQGLSAIVREAPEVERL